MAQRILTSALNSNVFQQERGKYLKEKEDKEKAKKEELEAEAKERRRALYEKLKEEFKNEPNN